MSMSMPVTPETGFGDVYRSIVERSPDLIVIIQNERLCYANPAAATVLGHAPQEFNHLNLSDIIAAGQQDVMAAMSRLVAGPLDSLQSDVRFVHKNGQMVPLHAACSTIIYNGAAAVLLVGRAMTERLEQQERLIQAGKAAVIGRFTSALAHELNNPLTVIVGFSEILLSNLKLDEQDQADLQMIASEANRARGMIHDVLCLSRSQTPRKQTVDINTLIIAALDRQRDSLHASGIEVVVESASDLPAIMADAAQLEEMLTYILTWLRKPLSSGPMSGRLCLRTQLKRPHGSSVQIILTDNRSSRYAEDMSRVFEPVFRTREEDKGLGLALAYNLIQQQGGGMSAVYHADEGVTFVIELPVNESSSVSDGPEARG